MNLVPMEESHLSTVLTWRNHPNVRKYMYTQHEISVTEHQEWFARARNDSTRRIFVAHEEDAPVGVVAFTEIDSVHQRASWAFYSGALDRPGVGSRMELAAIRYAFTELGLNKLWCEVLSTNPKVVALHRKFGFAVEGIFRQHYVLDGASVDVIRLALFREVWNKYLRDPMEAAVLHRIAAPGIAVGQQYEEHVIVTKKMMTQFARLSGDGNPIHRNARAARAAGFRAPVAHGMLLGAVLSGIFGSRFPGPGTVYVRQNLSFIAPVLEGDEILVRARVVSRVGRMLTVDIEIRRARVDLVARGEAELLVPRTTPVVS